ncbi:MAG: phage tail protein [Spirulinaceae cyanobacterium]
MALPEVLANSRFYIELELDESGEIDAYFQDCSGFKRTIDVIEVAEVSPQKWGSSGSSYGAIRRTKLPGNVKSESITLKRGLTQSVALWRWFKYIEQGNWDQKYRSGSITIYDQGSSTQAMFQFTGAWPVSYSIGDLSAAGSDLMIEELELSVDEFYRVDTKGNEIAAD